MLLNELFSLYKLLAILSHEWVFLIPWSLAERRMSRSAERVRQSWFRQVTEQVDIWRGVMYVHPGGRSCC